MSGNVEVRGIVNKDGTISYGEYTQYDNEFGKFNLLKYFLSNIYLTFITYRLGNSRTHAWILPRYVQGLVCERKQQLISSIYNLIR